MKDLAISGRLIALILILIGAVLLLFNPLIGLLLIAIGVVIWNLLGVYLRKNINNVNSKNDRAEPGRSSEYKNHARTSESLFETDDWKRREHNFDRQAQFQQEIEPISSKYYSQMKKIESDWSVLYNSKDYSGTRGKDFEQQCRMNINLYKQMAKIEKSYGETPPANVPAFKRLAMLYEKQGLYEKSADVCKEALNCGANGDGMEARLIRMTKKISD